MGASPLPPLFIIGLTAFFTAILGGTETTAASFPTFEEPDDGIFGALDALIIPIKMIFGVVVYLFNLITFNVDGAPTNVRVFVGLMMGGCIIWAIAATLIRGAG